jgi:hypothetical protein
VAARGAEHLKDFCTRYWTLLEEIVTERMRTIGVPEERIGMLDADNDYRLAALHPHRLDGVRFENGAVSCLWKGGTTNRVAEEFALRMQKETGCVIADVGGYRVIEPGEILGLNEQNSAAGRGATTVQGQPA